MEVLQSALKPSCIALYKLLVIIMINIFIKKIKTIIIIHILMKFLIQTKLNSKEANIPNDIRFLGEINKKITTV